MDDKENSEQNSILDLLTLTESQKRKLKTVAIIGGGVIICIGGIYLAGRAAKILAESVKNFKTLNAALKAHP